MHDLPPERDQAIISPEQRAKIEAELAAARDRQAAAGKDAKRPRGRSSFGIHERFYDRVEYFNDPYFWADYNIIEPSERLENAITKLKKKVTRP